MQGRFNQLGGLASKFCAEEDRQLRPACVLSNIEKYWQGQGISCIFV